MHQISKAKLKQFKRLYWEHFGIELNEKETQVKAKALVMFVNLSYRSLRQRSASALNNPGSK